ncbi:MAG: MotA/TolQ/ExbB proton channel family protein, partial [Chthoniobacterales bacterium]
IGLMPAFQLFAQAADGIFPSGGPETLWKYLQAGGIFMFPLAALSVITVALIFVYFITLRRGAVVTSRYMATADALLRKGDYLGLLAVSNRHNEAIARVMQRMLDFLTRNPRATFAEAREIAETEGTRQAGALNQQITYLTDIGTIAPMLGLLGTVAGMIRSFSVMGMGQSVSKPMLLAQGIAEALIATATGLLIAIPAMAAYAFFRGRVQGLIADLEGASAQLISLLAARLRNDLPAETSDKKTE